VEIPSPAAGVVSRILVGEGQVVPVGAVLLVIGGDASDTGEAPAPGDAAGAAMSQGQSLHHGSGRHVPEGDASEGRVRATPLVRRLAGELRIDLAAVRGTGPQGRVTEEDVRAAAASQGLRLGRVAEGRREPLRGIRRLAAEHMARAHREVAPVTWVEECDFSGVDLKLLVPLLLRACAQALQLFPELNARLEGDEIVYLDRYDLGIAVQTDKGLVVPVVRGCDTRSVEELRAEVDRLADAARSGTLKPEELRGSTFSITSAGKVAGLFQTPIVNHPEVAILSVGRVASRPVVRDGEVVVAPMGHVAITFDHRVVDGARAAAFGLAVIARLEGAES
jgi:pyruvate/2-oxoglutarate dehydrogenase complex dihydrolipoamide acyltransferase (E2) component